MRLSKNADSNAENSNSQTSDPGVSLPVAQSGSLAPPAFVHTQDPDDGSSEDQASSTNH